MCGPVSPPAKPISTPEPSRNLQCLFPDRVHFLNCSINQPGGFQLTLQTSCPVPGVGSLKGLLEKTFYCFSARALHNVSLHGVFLIVVCLRLLLT